MNKSDPRHTLYNLCTREYVRERKLAKSQPGVDHLLNAIQLQRRRKQLREIKERERTFEFMGGESRCIEYGPAVMQFRR